MRTLIVFIGLLLSGIGWTGIANGQIQEREFEYTYTYTHGLSSGSFYPAIEFGSGLFRFSYGIGWNLYFKPTVEHLTTTNVGNGVLTTDTGFRIGTRGAFLRNPDFNRRPLRAYIGWEFGLRILEPLSFFDENPELFFRTHIRRFDRKVLHSYRFALGVEANTETTQRIEDIFAGFGPYARLENVQLFGWSAFMPSFELHYEFMYVVSDPALIMEDFNQMYRRIRFTQIHEVELSGIGLKDFVFLGGYQLTYDLGQTEEYIQQGLGTRFGLMAEIAYRPNMTGLSIELYMRYSEGRIAPLINSERSFALGFRLPYRRFR